MSAPILRFAVSCYWNGSLVCHAVATATMASDIAREHVCANFAGPQVARYRMGLTGLGDRLETLSRLQTASIDYSDDTGAAVASITRIH